MPVQTPMKTMKAVQVGKKSGSFDVVEKDIPTPGRDQVRVQVKACGICHSDVLTKEGLWPGIQYPRSPGHEIAGVTTFNALRNSGAQPPDLVAVQGIGGLGHLGIQFASKMGFKVAAISKGKDKEALARQLGAHIYIDSDKGDPAAQLTSLGGARVILATAPSGKSMTALIGGLGRRGELLVLGAGPDPIEANSFVLISQSRSVQGWASGNPADSEDALNFCALTGVRAMIETFPLAKVSDAFDRMMSNKVRFRAVLTH